MARRAKCLPPIDLYSIPYSGQNSTTSAWGGGITSGPWCDRYSATYLFVVHLVYHLLWDGLWCTTLGDMVAVLPCYDSMHV